MKKLFNKSKESSLNSIEKGDFYPKVYEHLNSVIKLDLYGKLLTFNYVFTEKYGYEEKDFKKPFLDVFLQSKSSKHASYFKKATLGITQKFDTVGVCKNGQIKDLSITLIPINDRNETYIYVIITNISKNKIIDNEHLLPRTWQNTFNGLEDICNFYYDAINDYHYYSEQFPNIFGINVNQTFRPSLKLLLQYVHEEDRGRVNDTIQNALKDRTSYQMEYRIMKNNQVHYLFEQGEIFLDQNGNLDGIVGFIQDITNSKSSEEGIDKEKQLPQIYNNPDVGIWSFNAITGECLDCSKGIEQICGYTKEDFNNGMQWSDLVYPEDSLQYVENQIKLSSGYTLQHQYRIIHKNGQIKWIQDYTIPTLDENVEVIQLNGLTSDITEQKLLEEKLKFLSEYDTVTNLPNNQKFINEIQSLTEKYANQNRTFAVMILDMDRLKFIMGTLGHQVGEELINQAANRIKKAVSENDFIARYREDRFGIIVDHLNTTDDVKYLARQLIDSFNEPFFIEDYQLFIPINIGISTFPETGVTSIDLFRNAKLALYKSQKNGKNNYHIISKSSSIQSYKSFIIGRDLKKAIENHEMELYFQPRVDANTNDIISAEALIRWKHPEWGMIAPHEFLTIAEDSGLIKEVDDWVLKEACKQLKNWKEKYIQIVPIAINISAIHFSIYNWHHTVEEMIAGYGIDPRNLEFEITESLLLNNNETVQNTITHLRNMGIKIALDDFGTGYSSLAYLTQFSFDIIKIDKSFIRNMLQNDKVLFIVKSIFFMAKELNIKVVAEGVETMQQLKVLRKEQCHEIQGYLFSHPVPHDEFEALLKKKILTPMDPKLKAKQSKRKYYRIQFPTPLEADMEIVSIGGNNVQLGKSIVLIEDMSIGGLRYVSKLNLPVREDMIFQFKTEILGKTITVLGTIVWKEEINEELLEYGIKLIVGQNEKMKLDTLLSSFSILLKNGHTHQSYRTTSDDINYYFKKLK